MPYNPIDSILQAYLREQLMGNQGSGASMQAPPLGVSDPTLVPGRVNYYDNNPQGYDEQNRLASTRDMMENVSPLATEGKVVSFGAAKAAALESKLKLHVGIQSQLREAGKIIQNQAGDTKEAINRIQTGLEKLKPRLDPRIGTPDFEKLSLNEKKLMLGQNAFDDYTTYNDMKDALELHTHQYKQNTGDYNKLLDTWRANENQLSKVKDQLKEIK